MKHLQIALEMFGYLVSNIIMFIGAIVLICLLTFVDAKSSIVITNDPNIRADIERSLEVNKGRISSNQDTTMLHLKLGE